MSIVTHGSFVMGGHTSFNTGREISQQSCGHDCCYFCPVVDKAKVPRGHDFPKNALPVCDSAGIQLQGVEVESPHSYRLPPSFNTFS